MVAGLLIVNERLRVLCGEAQKWDSASAVTWSGLEVRGHAAELLCYSDFLGELPLFPYRAPFPLILGYWAWCKW